PDRVGVMAEDARRGVAAYPGGEHVHDRRFERFVMRGERSLTHQATSEQPSGAFGIHDKRANDIRLHGRTDVRHVVAAPLRAIPLQELAAWIPRLAGSVGRGSVVRDAAIGPPWPCPLGI